MDERTKHDENIKREFEASHEDSENKTQTDKEGTITSLGKVDPSLGRGFTSPDDPEIKRLQSLVGYVEFDLTQLPSGGHFYREDFSLHIRPARVGEIRDFSTMDETNIRDVDEKLNNMLMMCTKVSYGKSVGSYKDILE